MGAGELHLPFGKHKIAPIAAYDVAEICAKILIDPSAHVSKTYELTGPEAKDMQGFAEDYAATLGRPVTYVPQELDAWIETCISGALATRVPHTAEHLRIITRLAAGGRYEGRYRRVRTSARTRSQELQMGLRAIAPAPRSPR